jgi:hypothetical protein
VTEPIRVVRVVRGQPDADELAAVVLALEIVAARPVAAAPAPASRWRMTYRPTAARQTPNVARAKANWVR